ncbi:MAG: putative Mg2+ transporter-C (MgtC) family protein [Parcubacteria group bacterium Gr01-1014_70]|nr:MAG: putative Mg2+ transporter-C (MgtC) family protein [Parcubacteria group bacterium Gr01-1014_70]
MIAIDSVSMQLFGQLALATLLGLLIGLEREHRRKAAGLRTYALVCLGAALFTILSVQGFRQFVTDEHSIDPSRVASQIVVGIGFLGAGLIFQQGDRVQGLTTAAALWVTAAIGVAVGVGMFSIAIFTTIITLAIVWLFRFVEEYVPRVQ